MKYRRLLTGNERGFAMSAVLLVLLLLMVVASVGTMQTVLDLRSTSHYDTGNKAFFAAEAGIVHALNAMNTPGVMNFQADIVGRWGNLYGAATKTIPSDARIAYNVIINADPGDPINAGRIVSTGFAPLQAQRTLLVAIAKSGFVGGPGAIHLAPDGGVSSQFTGNAFEIDGNDHDMFGNLVAGGETKPGISTRNDTVADDVINSLNDEQKDNVRGLGFSLNPLTPSVVPTSGPDVDALDQVVANLLSMPGVFTTNDRLFNASHVWGTTAAPQITHMTNADVVLNGNASGAGILIVDGSITVNGTLDFIGWVIVRGATIINHTGDVGDDTIVLGDATILGSLWTGHLDIKVGGSAILDYCDECMQLVDTMGPPTGLIPRPMKIVSWGEVL